MKRVVKLTESERQSLLDLHAACQEQHSIAANANRKAVALDEARKMRLKSLAEVYQFPQALAEVSEDCVYLIGYPKEC